MSSSSAQQRVHLVTGANKGLGFEAVRQLATQDPQALVLLGARDVQRGEQAVAELKLPNVKFLPLDCTSESSVAQAVQTVTSEYKRLDWLINNAGIAVKSAQDTFDVNYYGAKRVIEAFLPLLRSTPGAKVVLVSSEVGAWCHNDQRPELQAVLDQPEKLSVSDVDALAADYLQFIKETQDSPQSAPTTKYTWVNAALTQWYGVSKTLVSTYGRVLAHQLKADRLPVIIVCPGYCATDLNHNSGFRSVQVGGASIVEATTHGLEDTGNFYQDGQLKSAKYPMPELYLKFAPKPKAPEEQTEGKQEQQ